MCFIGLNMNSCEDIVYTYKQGMHVLQEFYNDKHEWTSYMTNSWLIVVFHMDKL